MNTIVRNRLLLVLVVAMLCIFATTCVLVLIQNNGIGAENTYTPPVNTTIEVKGTEAQKNIIIDDNITKKVDISVDNKETSYVIFVEAPAFLNVELVDSFGEKIALVYDETSQCYTFDSDLNGSVNIDGFSLLIKDTTPATSPDKATNENIVSVKVVAHDACVVE